MTANPFMRDDTFFGVCEAIGQDFGFNPLWLRIALAAPLVFAPWYAVGAYALLGIAVIASRLLFPVPRRKAQVADLRPPVPANETAPAPLPLAA